MATKKKTNSGKTYCRDPELFSHLQNVSRDVEAWDDEKRTVAVNYIRSGYVRNQSFVDKQKP